MCGRNSLHWNSLRVNPCQMFVYRSEITAEWLDMSWWYSVITVICRYGLMLKTKLIWNLKISGCRFVVFFFNSLQDYHNSSKWQGDLLLWVSVSWLSSLSRVLVLFGTLLTLNMEKSAPECLALSVTEQLMGQTHRWVPMSICFIGAGVKFHHLLPVWTDKNIRHTAFFFPALIESAFISLRWW